MARITMTQITNDRTDEILRTMKEQALIGLESIGMECEGFAKEDCPVDTSTLKNSLTHEVRPNKTEVAIGSRVKYAPYVEYRDNVHHTVGKAHFLRDAVADHMDFYASIMNAALDALSDM